MEKYLGTAINDGHTMDISSIVLKIEQYKIKNPDTAFEITRVDNYYHGVKEVSFFLKEILNEVHKD